MLAQKKLKPGQPGTKELVEQYGGRLFAVRYRCDPETETIIKTVEIIIEEKPYRPRKRRLKPEQMVGIKIGYKEFALQRKVKEAGAKWNPTTRLWELRFAEVERLGLTERIEQTKIANTGKSQLPNTGKS